MSKRAQERRTEEGLVVSKSIPACFVSRNLSAKQSPSLGSGASDGPGNQELGQNSVFTSTGKLVRRGVCERSSKGKPVRGIQNQLARTKLAYHNLHISGKSQTNDTL